MKPNAFQVFAAALILACAFSAPARGQSPPPSARKFDEFSTGIGGPYARWYSHEAVQKELERRIRLYVAQLRREGARPYVITYGARVVEYEYHSRSVAGLRASSLWPHLTGAGVDWRHINRVNGGFREHAATELWIVPPGAQPPCPTPTVRPEIVAYCPQVRVEGSTYIPNPSAPLHFKAVVNVNVKQVNPTFSWQVSQGEIVEGQGTDTITVGLPQGASGEVVAKVEAHGYSLECPVESSVANAKTAVGATHFKLDEFGDIRIGDTKARLDNLALELLNDPTLQVHLVVYGGRTGPRGEAARRALQLKTYLVSTRSIDPARVITVEGGFRDELSGELWLSPLGAPAPPARPTIDDGYFRPKGGVK